jgi:hypothetical protein
MGNRVIAARLSSSVKHAGAAAVVSSPAEAVASSEKVNFMRQSRNVMGHSERLILSINGPVFLPQLPILLKHYYYCCGLIASFFRRN